jgi:fatty-acyl-CoA synthase
MINLSTFIRFHALRTPDKPAIVYKGTTVSYADFLSRIEATAAVLAHRGIGAGDVVAVFMKNSLAFLEIAFAASHIGAVFLPVNYRLAAEEVAYITGNAGAKLVLADAEFAEVVKGQPALVLLDESAQSRAALIGGPPAGTPRAALHVRRTDDLFRLMYTSGTTDRPKGVMHSYGNFYWKCLDHILALGLSAHDRLLVVGPLYHVGAFDLPGVAVLLAGGRLVVHRDFDPAAVLAAIDREGITGAWMAPVMLNRLLELPGRERFDAHQPALAGRRWRAHAEASASWRVSRACFRRRATSTPTD